MEINIFSFFQRISSTFVNEWDFQAWSSAANMSAISWKEFPIMLVKSDALFSEN